MMFLKPSTYRNIKSEVEEFQEIRHLVTHDAALQAPGKPQLRMAGDSHLHGIVRLRIERWWDISCLRQLGQEKMVLGRRSDGGRQLPEMARPRRDGGQSSRTFS